MTKAITDSKMGSDGKLPLTQTIGDVDCIMPLSNNNVNYHFGRFR